jgi:hypothetical protein
MKTVAKKTDLEIPMGICLPDKPLSWAGYGCRRGQTAVRSAARDARPASIANRSHIEQAGMTDGR